MTAELRRSLGLAGIGLLCGFLLVVGLFGAGEYMKRASEPARPGEARAPAGVLDAPSGRGTDARPESSAGDPGKARAGSDPSPAEKPQATLAPAPGQPAARPSAEPEARPPAALPEAGPTFDVIRVEPDGESVIAGRGAPNTTVELLVNGKPVARALADPSGQFAIVPPTLAPGSSDIVLRSAGPDGREQRSKQSVAVVIAPKRDAKPLVALTSPDQPTVVLSQPESGPQMAGMRPGATATGEPQAGGPGAPSKAEAGAKPEAQAAAPVKIVSVDAQEGGRLYITSQAAPGATVRLYLNDTLVAPGSVGADGKVTFTIGRGVRPGDYKVRVDQVDPVSGKVRARSEVPFSYPTPARVASRERPEAPPSPTSRAEGQAPAQAPRPSSASPMPGAAQARPHPAPEGAPLAAPAQPEARPEIAPRSPPTRPPEIASEGTKPAAAAAPPEVALEASARAETPAAQTSAAPAPGEGKGVFVAEINTAKITRGDSLWQISRRTYGKGDRYTVIYDANQGQIRDPDLIYPGQIFVLPTDEGAAQRQKKRG
ncbi:nucleoid-associated protein YgaU [Methylobacterium sp. BE186]|uniref:LysM peptidoglycan-binding domain-containing protein n=1 Tax=Methylobacterium sp. BE186 TaxID=2817715 RepID=UPI00285DD2C2|nr:LysM peptidoglycan-binding domain-containing protein [Methylobacterium sp. BE186]MDR7038284.1 nucleoid-associated protein YgaU [Methylobacterium sp. BE186]